MPQLLLSVPLGPKVIMDSFIHSEAKEPIYFGEPDVNAMHPKGLATFTWKLAD